LGGFGGCSRGLIASFAQRDEPIRSGRGQIRVAVVSGVGQHGTDAVIGVVGGSVQLCRGVLCGAHHRHETVLVVGRLAHADRDDQLVAADRDLCVVSLQEPFPGRHDR
jgi:hypothetical protein